MIKKRIVITALTAMLAAGMATPAYAGAFDVVADIRAGKYNDTGTSKTANDTVSYPGRIEGTWQQRGNDWYYVLPDGTDLKNGYVDGYYMSWTGRWIPEMSRRRNVLVYNTVYGGQDPNWYMSAGTGSSMWESGATIGGLPKYTDNGIFSAVDYTTVAYKWMDAVAQEAVRLPETDRVSYLANALDAQVNYCVYDNEGGTINEKVVDGNDGVSTIVSGEGVCEGFASAYEALCQRAGLSCAVVFGKASNGVDHAWNKVTLSDGSVCYVDVTFLSATHNAKYANSSVQWAGYVTE